MYIIKHIYIYASATLKKLFKPAMGNMFKNYRGVSENLRAKMQKWTGVRKYKAMGKPGSSPSLSLSQFSSPL